MKKIIEVLNDAGIGKFKLIWTALTGGWDDLGDLVRKFINHLLGKVDAEKLKLYGERFSKTGILINYAVELFGVTGTVSACLRTTATCFGDLGRHCEDGNYTKEELDLDVDNIRNSIAAWSEAKKMGIIKKAILAVIGALAAAAALVAILIFGSGCTSYKEGGTSLVVGEQMMLPEVTEPNTECAIRIYESIKGARVWSRANHATTVEYENATTNTYFGVMTTEDWMKLKVKVEPCEDQSESDEDHNKE